MTWYANNLYMPATDRVVNALKSISALAPFSYVVNNLDGFKWHTPDVKHSVGPEGLAVVRPLAAPDSGSADWYNWYGEAILDWTSLHPHHTSLGLPATVPKEDWEPPTSLLEFLAQLSAMTDSLAIYYASSTWGGKFEYEASWVLMPKLLKYITDIETAKPTVRCISDRGDQKIEDGDALQKGLKHLGIELPTRYFELHTRDFPWMRYRVM